MIKMDNSAAFEILSRRKGMRNLALQAAVAMKSVEKTKVALSCFKRQPTEEELLRTPFGQEIYELIK